MRTSSVPATSLALCFALTAAFAPVARADDGPFGPIHVAANRSQYSGTGCPIEIVYTATVNFVTPLPKGFVFNYRWERSDGAKGPEKVVRPKANQRSMVIRETWRAGAPGKHFEASVTLLVNSGNTHLSEQSPTVNVTCK